MDAQQPPPPPGHHIGARVDDHQPLNVGGRAARGVADIGNINAARAAAPGAHQPNNQARGAPAVDIHRPVPPEAVSDLVQEFLSSMPDVSRSSLAELGLPAYRWPSIN